MEAVVNSMPQACLKSAYKTFKFWYKVMLETELMDDHHHRKEFRAALQTIKYHKKKKE
jgi:hypothetical protein